MAEGHEFLEYLYLSCKGPAASERALAAGKAGEAPFSSAILSIPLQAGKAGEATPFQQHASHNLLRQAGKAGKAPASYQQVTGKLKYEAKSPLQLCQLKIGHFSREPPASYRQVTSKLNYEAKTPLQMRQLKIDHFGVNPPASYQQVTSKLPASYQQVKI